MDSSLRRTIEDAGLDPDAGPATKARELGWRAKARATIAQLIDAMRAQPGINVRLPSMHQPPFRSVPVGFQARSAFPTEPAAADRRTIYWPVTWNGPVRNDNGGVDVDLSTAPSPPDADPFPEGFVGHVWIRCFGYCVGTNTLFAPLTSFRWSVFRQGQLLEGYEDRSVETIEGASVGVATPDIQRSLIAFDVAPKVPLLVLPGDRVVVRMDRLVDGFGSFAGPIGFVAVEGWRYPIRRASQDITSTLTD